MFRLVAAVLGRRVLTLLALALVLSILQDSLYPVVYYFIDRYANTDAARVMTKTLVDHGPLLLLIWVGVDVLNRYLQGLMGSPILRAEFNRERAHVRTEENKTSKHSVNKEEKDELHRQLLDSVRSDFFNSLVNRLETKYAEAVVEKNLYDDLRTNFSTMRNRLEKEISSLNRRGNVNLVTGLLMSVFGLCFLGISVIQGPLIGLSAIQNEMQAIVYYVSRTSFVILIEIIAFFFLNLYKSSLGEIKYYQNEITNLESKSASLVAAVLSNDRNIASGIAQEIAKTDRNFIMQKGQTTVELEKQKIDTSLARELIKRVPALLGTAKNDRRDS